MDIGSHFMTNPATASPRVVKNKPAAKVVKRKRKRRSGYITGTYVSPKCILPINYRSGWEKTICGYLDNDPSVLRYTYESMIINYTSNQTSKKLRKYFPDFLVWYIDGSIKMIEVKRENLLANPRVQRKAAAAKIWCAQQNPKIVYEFWTDKMILPLQRMEKLKLLTEKVPPKKKKKK